MCCLSRSAARNNIVSALQRGKRTKGHAGRESSVCSGPGKSLDRPKETGAEPSYGRAAVQRPNVLDGENHPPRPADCSARKLAPFVDTGDRPAMANPCWGREEGERKNASAQKVEYKLFDCATRDTTPQPKPNRISSSSSSSL